MNRPVGEGGDARAATGNKAIGIREIRKKRVVAVKKVYEVCKKKGGMGGGAERVGSSAQGDRNKNGEKRRGGKGEMTMKLGVEFRTLLPG